MKAEKKQTNKNLGFLGNSITHSRTGLRAHNQACMRRQNNACASPCPEKLKMQKTGHKQEKPNSNNLVCSIHKQIYILP